MKKINSYTIIVCVLLAVVWTSCNKKLEEHPISNLTPGFFTTQQGIQAGLDAAYAGFRTIYGPDTYFEMSVGGTDEFQAGVDGTGSLVRYSSGFNTSDGTVAGIWKNCYTFINTCNGLIDYLPALTGMDAATKAEMTAEAKFLRANYYFILVQNWADVTVNKHFQSAPTLSATRDKLADAYDLIIQDLNDAIAGLPASPQTANVLAGKATKIAAMHVLAKVYLTRGYSSVKQSDDFKNAASTAASVINTVAPANGVKLLQDFGKVYAEGNEANTEVLWTVQHTTSSAYNGSPTQNNSGPDNLYVHLFVPRYEAQPGMQRDIYYGRPYARVMPTRWLTDTAFKDKTNDTRYFKTFQSVWIANNPANLPLDANKQPKFKVGDTAIYMPGIELTAAQIAKYRYQVVPPSKYVNTLYPTMLKYYDDKRTDLNAPSVRPIIIYRLAETYLIAAEALLQDGRPNEAVPFINAIRERAAYPSGNVAAMDITAADVNLDFILDERAREMCGELCRWQDLMRTGTLLARVKKHNTDAGPNIKNFHVLRPIPQTQIDGTITGPKYDNSRYFPNWN
ncbi:RagB/SusD domain-containing protein [Mucilaginibacter yixingensis]|uniref:RagB/SusD domain-containing protein n=1 Tax=Mucilaginibacter yixingensis TaxID=1295612 RepID=A0A2T5JGL8_9SPHI|nr:RagB/SusD family nutrient uptake outer membrane protein [Mucilaginibacter yixingensis]PTR01565.1 RagB/SusD domain-containing protein [Mucilaginibacter yixingensis]